METVTGGILAERLKFPVKNLDQEINVIRGAGFAKNAQSDPADQGIGYVFTMKKADARFENRWKAPAPTF